MLRIIFSVWFPSLDRTSLSHKAPQLSRKLFSIPQMDFNFIVNNLCYKKHATRMRLECDYNSNG